MTKKILMLVFLLFTGSTASAGIFFNLGYDSQFLSANNLLGVNSTSANYFNGELGWISKKGFMLGLKYDHIDMEDYVVSGQNVKVVAVIPSLGIGYSLFFLKRRLVWSTHVYVGYCVSSRYRLNTVNYEAMGLAPAATTGIQIRLHGKFYAGIEAGYRYLQVSYPDLGNKTLDLSGAFAGIMMTHFFGK